jgi:hypothetical protein
MISKEERKFIMSSVKNGGDCHVVMGMLIAIREGEEGGTIDSVTHAGIEAQKHDPHMQAIYPPSAQFLRDNMERFKIK